MAESKSTWGLGLVLTLLLLCYPIGTVILTNKLPELYLKGEEQDVLNLDEYFEGENVTFSLPIPHPAFNLTKGTTKLYELKYINDTKLKYKSSLLVAPNINDTSQCVLVILYESNVMQEFRVFQGPLKQFAITFKAANHTFEGYSSCILKSNLNNNPPELVTRCRRGKEGTKFTPYVGPIGTEQLNPFEETALPLEDQLKTDVQYDVNMSAVLSHDSSEQRIYVYHRNPSTAGLFALTELYSLKDYSGKRQPFTDFVLKRPYTMLLYCRRYLIIYLQEGAKGISRVLSNVTLPIAGDKLYYDQGHEVDMIYVYTQRGIHVASVNITHYYNPHVVRTYEVHTDTHENIQLVASKSFLIVYSHSQSFMHVFNKEPQLQASAYSAVISLIHIYTLNYAEDTFLYIYGQKLEIIQIHRRRLSVRIRSPNEAQHFDLTITANDGQELNATLPVHILPSYSEESFFNPALRRNFSILAGDTGLFPLDGYFLCSNDSYVGKHETQGLRTSLVPKLQLIRYRNYTSPTLMLSGIHEDLCSSRGEQEIYVNLTVKLAVLPTEFKLLRYDYIAGWVQERVIVLPEPKDRHCILNSTHCKYALWKERYFFFLLAHEDGRLSLNVLDLWRTNINIYHSRVYLVNDRFPSLVRSCIELVDVASGQFLFLSDTQHMGSGYDFRFFESSQLLVETAALDHEDRLGAFVELHHRTGGRVTLTFDILGKNMQLVVRQAEETIKQKYSSLDEALTLNLGPYVQGFNASCLPMIDQHYYYKYYNMRINQQVTHLKDVLGLDSWYICDITMVRNDSLVVITKWSNTEVTRRNEELEDDTLNPKLAFYEKLNLAPLEKAMPTFKSELQVGYHLDIVFVGPLMTLNEIPVVLLYTRELDHPSIVSFRFFSMLHKQLLPPYVPLSFHVADLEYNDNTKHLFILEHPPLSSEPARIFVMSTARLSIANNNFVAILNASQIGLPFWKATTMAHSGSLIYIGLRNLGVAVVRDAPEFEHVGSLNLTTQLQYPEFALHSLLYSTAGNLSVLFGVTDHEVFILNATKDSLTYIPCLHKS